MIAHEPDERRHGAARRPSRRRSAGDRAAAVERDPASTAEPLARGPARSCSVYRAPEVVQRAVAPPMPGAWRMRPVEIVPRAARWPSRSASPSARFAAIADDSVQPVPCVCRVSIRGRADLEGLVRRAGHVDRVGALEVAPLDEYDARAHLQDPPAGVAHVLERADRACPRALRLPACSGVTIVRARQQLGPHRGDGVVLQQPVAALGDHHRIDDDVREIERRRWPRRPPRRSRRWRACRSSRRRRRCRRRPLRSAR